MVEINLKELARKLDCSVPTVTSMIERWPDFPVLQRGDKGRQWKFDAEAVVTYLTAKRDADEAAKAEKNELLAQLTLPIRGVDETGEIVSLDERIKAVKLRNLERNEAKENGFLVPTHEVRTALEQTMRRWAQVQESAIDRVVRNHNLPEAVRRSIEREFQEARTRFVGECRAFLDQTGSESRPGGPGDLFGS